MAEKVKEEIMAVCPSGGVAFIDGKPFNVYIEEDIKRKVFGYIYVTRHVESGKSYVGMCSSWKPNYYGSGTYIRNAIKKHGVENFEKTIIDVGESFDDLADKELFYIKLFNSTKSPDWYNISSARQNSGVNMEGMTPEDYQKHVERCRIRATGRFPSEETKRRMSVSQRKRKVTPETRLKMSIAQMGKKRIRSMSEEERKRWGEAHEGMKQPNKSYWFDIYDDKGKFVRHYTSFSECSKDLGITLSCLKNMLDGDPVSYRSKRFKGYTMVQDKEHNDQIYRLSRETRSRISKNSNRKPVFSHKINVIDDTGHSIGEFSSIEECSEKTGIGSTTLQRLRKGWIPTEKSKYYKWIVETM